MIRAARVPTARRAGKPRESALRLRVAFVGTDLHPWCTAPVRRALASSPVSSDSALPHPAPGELPAASAGCSRYVSFRDDVWIGSDFYRTSTVFGRSDQYRPARSSTPRPQKASSAPMEQHGRASPTTGSVGSIPPAPLAQKMAAYQGFYGLGSDPCSARLPTSQPR